MELSLVRRSSVPMYFVTYSRVSVILSAGAYEEVLRQAKETAIKEMEEQAARLGANAVIGVDLDYETVGGSGSMLMVTATGTAVVIE